MDQTLGPLVYEATAQPQPLPHNPPNGECSVKELNHCMKGVPTNFRGSCSLTKVSGQSYKLQSRNLRALNIYIGLTTGWVRFANCAAKSCTTYTRQASPDYLVYHRALCPVRIWLGDGRPPPTYLQQFCLTKQVQNFAKFYKALKILQTLIRILPKWRNLAKSSHTDYCPIVDFIFDEQ